MKKSPLIVFVLLCLLFVPLVASPKNYSTQQPGPTLLKRTVAISARRFLRHWPNPAAAEPKYNTWSWVPKVEFEVIGPVPGGSQWMFEVSTPDGKPWVSYKLPTQEVTNDEVLTIKGPEMDDGELEKKAITQTGLFPYKLTLKNALAGTNEVFLQGKFKVATYAPDQAIPEYKGKQEFYVVQDWRLPVGFIWYDPRMDEEVPTLNFQMWFRGTRTADKMEGVLFYKGQQIGTSNSNQVAEISTGVGDPEGRWQLWEFNFPRVRGFNKGSSATRYDGMFFLDKNPGDYEIKVLRTQKLARSGAFAVGADGMVVDNGIAKQNKMGGIRMVLPVKILGDLDVKYDPLSWKSDTIYGNLLTGFTAP